MFINLDGWHGVSPPAAEGVPHGGMGGARTEIYHDRTHPFVHVLHLANKKVLIIAMNHVLKLLSENEFKHTNRQKACPHI